MRLLLQPTVAALVATTLITSVVTPAFAARSNNHPLVDRLLQASGQGNRVFNPFGDEWVLVDEFTKGMTIPEELFYTNPADFPSLFRFDQSKHIAAAHRIKGRGIVQSNAMEVGFILLYMDNGPRKGWNYGYAPSDFPLKYEEGESGHAKVYASQTWRRYYTDGSYDQKLVTMQGARRRAGAAQWCGNLLFALQVIKLDQGHHGGKTTQKVYAHLEIHPAPMPAPSQAPPASGFNFLQQTAPPQGVTYAQGETTARVNAVAVLTATFTKPQKPREEKPCPPEDKPKPIPSPTPTPVPIPDCPPEDKPTVIPTPVPAPPGVITPPNEELLENDPVGIPGAIPIPTPAQTGNPAVVIPTPVVPRSVPLPPAPAATRSIQVGSKVTVASSVKGLSHLIPQAPVPVKPK